MKNDFATKADLRKTSEELHQEISAVRTDLSKTEKALRQDIASVRTDLSKTENALRQEIVTVREDLHQEISDVKTELSDFKIETRERFDVVITAIDGLAGLILNGQTEKASVDHALRLHEGMLDNHETRIRSLEPKS